MKNVFGITKIINVLDSSNVVIQITIKYFVKIIKNVYGIINSKLVHNKHVEQIMNKQVSVIILNQLINKR